MKECCIKSGENFFKTRYPLEGTIEQDHFMLYLKNLCKKWGDITDFAINTENFYIRTASSPEFGLSAETGTLKCETCSQPIEYIFLGSRLYYFIWRINMVCATYWEELEADKNNDTKSLFGSGNWPNQGHMDQLQVAIDKYFGKESFLDTKGLLDLNKKIFESAPNSLILHFYIVDFAELFVLFHELQHIIPIQQSGIEKLGLKVTLPDNLDITQKRAKYWTTELNCDINSLYLLFLSVSDLFSKNFGLTLAEAKEQAASLVCTGADSALHSIQVLEELRYGKVEIKDAVYSNEFIHHPPAEYRRTIMSQASYMLVTGKEIGSLYRNEITESWSFVADNVRSHMKVFDMLLNKYKETRN